jgi:hypothetical protein
MWMLASVTGVKCGVRLNDTITIESAARYKRQILVVLNRLIFLVEHLSELEIKTVDWSFEYFLDQHQSPTVIT